MDVFNLLSYINKISLFAFFITTLVVGYQIYVIKKEKSKEKAPTIPDFKENNNLNVVANYTSLPSSLTKKELKAVNYSKLIFLIISLLTIIIVIFVVSLIKKNSSTSNQTANNQPKVTVTTAPLNSELITPTPKEDLTPSPTVFVETIISPTILVPTLGSQPTAEPTEIILAVAPSLTPAADSNNQEPTVAVSALQTLPETGSLGKGLLIFGVAISTIFFSFWF